MGAVAFIGTRQPRLVSPAVVRLFSSTAAYAAHKGAIVFSGATPGAEQIAAETALTAGGEVRLYLPWSRYEEKWVSRIERRYPGKLGTSVFDPQSHAEWLQAVHAQSPQSERLASGSLAFQARYYGMLEAASAAIVMPFVRPGRAPVPASWFGRRTRLGRNLFGRKAVERNLDKGGAELPLRFAQVLSLRCFDLSEEPHRILLTESLTSDVPIASIALP